MATIAYTAEQTRDLINRYKADPRVAIIATDINRSVKSVIAKLSKEHVYAPTSKPKKVNTLSKGALIAGIAVALGANEEVLESLEKANHGVLDLIYKVLAEPINRNSLGSEKIDLKP